MNKLVTTLGVVSVVFAGVSAVLGHRVWMDYQRVADLQARVAELEASGARKPQPSAPLAAMSSPPQVAIAPEPAPVPPAIASTFAANVAAVQADIEEKRARRQEAMKDPEFRAALIERRKAQLRMQYANLPSWLGMPDSVKEQLIALMAQQQMDMSDAMGSGRLASASSDPEERKRQIDQMQQDQEAQIAQLLGAERQQRWKEYRDTGPERTQLSNLNAQLGAESLSEGQMRTLAGAMAQARQTAQTEIPTVPVWDPTATYKRKLAVQRRTSELQGEAARTHLSGKQLNAFQTLQELQRINP